MVQKNAIQNFSHSVTEILRILEKNKILKIHELNNLSSYSSRTVRRAIQTLMHLQLVFKLTDLNDNRSFFLISRSEYLTKDFPNLIINNLQLAKT